MMITSIFSYWSSCYDLLLSYVGSLVVGAIVLLVGFGLLDLYNSQRVCKSESRMDGKVVVITGCNSGIGKETAKDLVRRGAKLIMASRKVERAKIVKEELVRLTGNHDIVVKKLDLTSLSSIREFAEQINREETRLDVLIHNAGTATSYGKKVTEDGLEPIMATNCYGPFLLTHLLIDLLKKSAPSRIVVVSSRAYIFFISNLLDNLNPTTSYETFSYLASKYANIVFTLELARRLKGSGVTANCLHPGIIWSEAWVNYLQPQRSWILKPIIKGFFKTQKQGAQTSIHLAVSDEVAEVSGKYFEGCQEQFLLPSVKDEAKGKKFWELSEGLVELKPTDPKI